MAHFLKIDMPLVTGVPIYLTPFGDTHIDSSDCDVKAVMHTLKSRAKMKNHYFVGIGDTFNLIYGHDFRASIKHARDDYMENEYINNMLKKAKQELLGSGAKFLAMGMGNHESALVKRFGINVTRMFCEENNIAYAGYSGVIRLHFKDKNNTTAVTHQIRWHHGGDGGAVTRGMPWANRYFAGFEGDDTCWFGHVHHLWMMIVSKTGYSERGNLYSRPQHIVCCGTAQRTQVEDSTTWSEVRGFPLTPHGYFPMTVLLPCKPDRTGGHVIKQLTIMGDPDPRFFP